MDFLYNVDSADRGIVADAGLEWIGPIDRFQAHKWITVARCDSPADSDGQSVLIQECAMPARFFRLTILEGPNSCGEIQPGYSLSTGSSTESHRALVAIARHIAEGMIGLYKDPERESVSTDERFTRVVK